MRFSIILAILVSAPAYAERDSWYWAAQSSIVADGLSTAYALDNNPCAYEGGPITRLIIGEHPTHAKLAGFVGLELIANDWLNKKLHGWYRKGLNGWTVTLQVFAIHNNTKVGNQAC